MFFKIMLVLWIVIGILGIWQLVLSRKKKKLKEQLEAMKSE
jgi:cytochrome oxidase assembly protein ShyY1